MPIKVFRPGGAKLKYPIKSAAPTNSQTTSTGVTIGNTTMNGSSTIPGPWMTVPVGKGWMNSSGPIPVIDLDLELEDDRDGLNCKRCKEFYPYAEANQEDGKTLICFSCRNGY